MKSNEATGADAGERTALLIPKGRVVPGAVHWRVLGAHMQS